MFDILQELAIGWLPFLEKNLWTFHKTLDRNKCVVYGTGYESWGVWAHLNANLLLAETISWDQNLFKNSPSQFRSIESRIDISIAMLNYALGYHTTGEFEGAGGTRWGGEPPLESQTKEGYNNWHSPLWVAFLAEVYFLLEDHLDTKTKLRFKNAVIADANVQINLNISNFDGEAEENTKASHPESNAWKACLILLARLLDPKHPNFERWLNLETRLWVSSFAKPTDIKNYQQLNGKKIGELVIGNHITETNNIVHHGFLHPCYMIFPLLSRVQAKRFCEKFKQNILPAITFREDDVFKQLKPFLLNGRVIYPAGQDWPRWVYGQNYLLPILLHRQIHNKEDHTEEINNLINVRRKDFTNGKDNSFVIHRFGNLLAHSAWEAHRFESDCAASLAQAIQLSKNLNNTPLQAMQSYQNELSYEPLAKTIYLRRENSFFSVSTRAFEGPAQITLVHKNNPHLLEWRNNGNPKIIRLHGIGSPKKDVIQNDKFKIISDDSFVASYETLHSKEAYKLPSFKTEVLSATLPKQPTMFIHQKTQNLCYTSASIIQQHVWRFTQSPHNAWQRSIKWQNSKLIIKHGEAINQIIDSNYINIDDNLFLALPKGQKHQQWYIEQNETMREDKTGVSWFEISVKISIDPKEWIKPEKIIAESAVIASLEPIEANTNVTFSEEFIDIALTNNHRWRMSPLPELHLL